MPKEKVMFYPWKHMVTGGCRHLDPWGPAEETEREYWPGNFSSVRTAAAASSGLLELFSRAGLADQGPNGIDNAASGGDLGTRTAAPYAWRYLHPSVTQTP